MDGGVVRLLHYPVAIGVRESERLADLRRELELVLIGRHDEDERAAVPRELLELTEVLEQRYASESSEQAQLRERAYAAGEQWVDLSYPSPPGMGEMVARYDRALDRIEAYCRAEQMLNVEAPPEQLAFRKWVCAEFRRQLAGEPPRPWDGAADVS